MKAFNDTNVPIAYVFLFEPQCVMARHIICDEYDEVYWSENVVDEFQNRVGEKQENLLRFYEKLEIELYSYRKFEYSLRQLEKFAENFSYANKKQEEDVLDSIKLFWNYYFQHSNTCVTENMIDSVKDFNTFLQVIIFDRMDFCEESHIITDELHKRTNHYPKLYALLGVNNVHKEDRVIALDAHDFSKTLDNPLDFITFDRTCCMGVSKSNLHFNRVKGLKDYDFLT